MLDILEVIFPKYFKRRGGHNDETTQVLGVGICFLHDYGHVDRI